MVCESERSERYYLNHQMADCLDLKHSVKISSMMINLNSIEGKE